MRKELSIFTAAVLVLMSALSALPTSAQVQRGTELSVGIKDFESDTYSVETDEAEKVKFTAQVLSDKAFTRGEVAVYEGDNRVASMHDDGLYGDLIANDGEYTAVVKLEKDDMSMVNYCAKIGSATSNSHSIKFCDEITEDDMAQARNIWNKLDTYKAELVKGGFTPEQIASAAYDYLMSTESNAIASAKVESEKAFSFILKSGIENYFEHFPDVVKSSDATEGFAEKIKSASYVGKSAIAVWCPYYGSDSNFNYCYRDAAASLKSEVGFEKIETYYGTEATVESFKKFDEYGVVLIDSHGADYNGGGYICIPRPGEYSTTDITEGHIVLSGSTVCLRGTFMEKYCDELPNTIVYIGICYGMAADNLYQPLINHGAAYVCGYDDSVSFTYDNLVMAEFCSQLGKTDSTSSQNTAGKAFDATVAKYGSVDTYSSNRAEFINKGDKEVVASPLAISVTAMEIAPEELTLYRNNTYVLNAVVTPSNANRYNVVWESSAEDVVSVSQTGELTAITQGTATIKCTLTDASTSPSTVYQSECAVTVEGDMPVSGISVEKSAITVCDIEVDTEIKASVLPANATNQTIVYTSDDESVAMVDEYGYVTPVSIGTTRIFATTEEGDFTSVIIVNVVGTDLNYALNKTGGDLTFETEGTQPGIESDVERLFAVTANKADQSSSSIKMNRNALEAGTIVKFDWKVSSEINYDKFVFSVNGSNVDSISGQKSWATYEYEVESDGDYEFKWTYTKDSSLSSGLDCAWLDEVEVVGDTIEHTVSFYDMDGITLIDSQQVVHGSAATTPQIPTHEGYTFVAWSADYSCVRGELVVTAIYDVNTYEVTFVDGLMNETISTEYVTHGESVELPTPPEHENYEFLGWDGTGENIVEDTVITASYMIIIPPVSEEPTPPVSDEPTPPVSDEPTPPVSDEPTPPVSEEPTPPVSEEPTPPVSDEPTPEYVIGDASGDGKVNTADAVLILRHAAGMQTMSGNNFLASDANRDGSVNTSDAVTILRFCAGMLVLPKGIER